jgi:hypothetical protein
MAGLALSGLASREGQGTLTLTLGDWRGGLSGLGQAWAGLGSCGKRCGRYKRKCMDTTKGNV